MKKLSLILILLASPVYSEVGGLITDKSITLGANLLTNGGFETGYFTGWSTPSACESVATDQVHSGTYSYKAVNLNVCNFTQSLRQNISFTAGYSYRLSGWIKTDNLGASSTGIRVYLRSSGTNGCDLGCSGTGIYYGTNDWTYFEIRNISFSATVTGSIKIEEYGVSASGTAWVDDLVVQREIPPDVEAKLLMPSYRGILWSDIPQEAIFRVTNNLGSGQIESVITYDSDPGNPVVANASTGLVTLPLTGTATVAFRIQGQATPDYPQYRIIATNASARSAWNLNWTNDSRFRINNTPTFLIGVYDSGLGYSSVESGYETGFGTYRRLDQIGGDVNSYLNYWYGGVPAASMSAGIDWLQTHNFKLYWQTANCFGSGAWNPTQFSTFSGGDNGLAYQQALAADAGVAGWYVMDECIDATQPTMFTDLKNLRNNAPKTANLAVGIGPTTIHKWYDSVDILATDPYPMYGTEPANGYPLNRAAEYTKGVYDAVEGKRPIMTVIQYFQFTSLGRWPTQAELRNMSLMAIAEGAQGLFYWSVGVNALAYTCTAAEGGSTAWCPTKVDLYDRLKNVVSELRSEEAIFLAADASTNLTSVSDSNIKARTKALHVIAYNNTYNATNSTFTWHTPVSSVSVVGESRTITPVGYTWTDSFGSYGAHIYEITEGGVAPATLTYQEPIVTSNSILIQYGHSTLADGVSCTATLKDTNGTTVGSPKTTTAGAILRAAQFNSLTASTLYNVIFTCTGFTDATYGITTLQAPAVTTTTASMYLKPATRMSTANKVKLDWGLTTGTITDNTSTTSCASGCTITLSSLTRGVQYQVRHTWLTSGDADIATSKTRYI